MSFSTSDLVSLSKYLGYPISEGMNSQIQTAAARISNLGSAYEDEVKSTLRQLDQIADELHNVRLGAGRSFQSGGAGTTQYYRGERILELQKLGRHHVATLSQLMNLNSQRDFFETSSPNSSSRIRRG